MNPHAEAVHGISVEKADRDGVEEIEACEKFGKMLKQANLIVCHNFDFDWNYVYQLMQRNLDKLSDEARSAFYLDLPNFCTMKDNKVKQFVGALNKAGRIKWPKLIELHEKLFNCGFDDAHDAYADIKATRDCYFELCKLNII